MTNIDVKEVKQRAYIKTDSRRKKFQALQNQIRCYYYVVEQLTKLDTKSGL